MGWYLVVRKSLIDDPKLILWADRILEIEPDCLGPGGAEIPAKRRLLRHALIGKIVTLWRVADRDIRSDNSLPVTLAGVTEIMDVTPSWLRLMPPQWLAVRDDGLVVLPKYCEENRIKGKDLRDTSISDEKREKNRLRKQRSRQNKRDLVTHVTRDTSRRSHAPSRVTVPPHRDHNRTPEPVMAPLASDVRHLAEPGTPKSERQPKPNGHHPAAPAKTPDQLRADACKLAATGLTDREVHRMLSQHGATLEQVATWLAHPPEKTA